MHLFITGANGRLGTALQRALTSTGHTFAATDIDTLDVTDFAATRAAVAAAQPQVVIHAAAWTDVDGCARDPQRAVLHNGLAAQNVALAAAHIGAASVYVSSNEVFDGRANRPYWEYDVPCPANPYGYSKYVGEQGTIAVNPRHYIVRTAWLFAHGGKNFVHAILGAARAGKPLRVVTDEVANPTYTEDLADAITALIATERYGVYHLVNSGFCSRYDFARHTLDTAGLHETPITRIGRHEYPRLSSPPPYCALDNLAGASVGVTLRPWQEAVEAFIHAEQPNTPPAV